MSEHVVLSFIHQPAKSLGSVPSVDWPPRIASSAAFAVSRANAVRMHLNVGDWSEEICGIRANPVTDSCGHLFRRKSATCSDPIRPPPGTDCGLRPKSITRFTPTPSLNSTNFVQNVASMQRSGSGSMHGAASYRLQCRRSACAGAA
jgi:hypothetical protein